MNKLKHLTSKAKLDISDPVYDNNSLKLIRRETRPFLRLASFVPILRLYHSFNFR
jgi:hypothetical protein